MKSKWSSPVKSRPIASKECASVGSKETKAVWLCPHGSCSKFAHRYEVSNRQRSMNGKEAIKDRS